jgi:hypothetical protein
LLKVERSVQLCKIPNFEWTVNWKLEDRESVADICLGDQIWEDLGCFVMLVKAGIAASDRTAAQPIPSSYRVVLKL